MGWIIIIVLAIVMVKSIKNLKYKKLESQVLDKLGFYNWNIVSYFDAAVTVKSRQALEKYDDIKFFRENQGMLAKAEKTIKQNNDIATTLRKFLENNEYKSHSQYNQVIKQIYIVLNNAGAFRVKVSYISSAGNNLGTKEICVSQHSIEYQQYLGDVPNFIMENDEVGFYSRLGFATIDESVLTVEYKFSYTSGGGMAQRSFTVPMTEETIAELIRVLESKLTASAFVKEQRTLMTKKLREFIKIRDNFTCCNCGNSTHVEPNLLLEIDHIIPVAKGGRTVEDNLQTLCWKCNRTKSDKLID